MATTTPATDDLRIDEEDLKITQNAFESCITKLVTGASPYPTPGRPLRNLAARCLNILYARGETKSRFDTVRALLSTAGDVKASEGVKVACLWCIGEIMAASGSQILSLMTDISNATVRLVKTSSLPVLVRYHAFLSLQKSLKTAGRGLTDAALKDVLKQTRYYMTDKALPIQRAAAQILTILHSEKESIKTVAEVESLVTLSAKGLEHADQPTRRSFSLLVAQVLSLTQVERPVVSTEKKASTKKDAGADDEADGPVSTLAETTKPLMTAAEMLAQISAHFNKPGASRKTRVGLFDFYVSLLMVLGPSWVETNYGVIVKHLITEIVVPVRQSTNTHDTSLVRKLVGMLLRDLIGVRMLSEQGQIAAIKELSEGYLKKWPALLPGQVAPHHNALVVALKEVAGLLQQLGNAPPPVQDALAEPLVHLLSHPNQGAQVAAAWCLRCFCFSTPLRLPKTVLSVVELLQRDITSLGTPPVTPEVGKRALGHANGLAALFAIIPDRPLYVSYDLSAKVFDMAIQLLKRAGEHDVAVAQVEVEVAWALISSLMALGPNFVRSHLPQLLVLWRNALPKPTSKDTSHATGRSVAEWTFLLRVREAALQAVLSFLRHNSPALVTLDVARRLASLLSNALAFANAFVGQPTEEIHDATSNLATREAMLRRRVYQCFAALGLSSATEVMQTTLLQSVVSLFASPDGYSGSSMQAAIASSTGNFSSVWAMTDGYAYGVTSTDRYSMKVFGKDEKGEGNPEESGERLNRDSVENAIDDPILAPIIGSCEHDTLALCRPQSVSEESAWPEPPPPMTGVVDAAIILFSMLLPAQDATSAARTINQIAQSIKSPKLERNLGRKAAIQINATSALLFTLRHAAQSRQARDVLGGGQVAEALVGVLKDAILDGDVFLRKAGSEAIGRLANFSGTTFLSTQTKFLVDQVVSNRDPQARAGCALAFGAIYSQVGGLAAGPLLKTTVNVLMSLGNDPHPVVHFHALSALSQVATSASLSYGPYVSSTLGLIFKLYMASTHEPEGGSLSNANLAGDLPAYQVLCELIDALISVLGPELQEPNSTRNLVFNLAMDFWKEDDEGIQVEAIKCIQHFLMFGANTMDIPELVVGFRAHLLSSRRPLKMASINALYQLVQRDAFVMSKVGGDRLVEELFAMLDDDSAIHGVRNIILSWLQQTVLHNPSAWIDLCQRIMSRTTASQRVTDAASKTGGLQDDEAESLSVGMGGNQAAAGGPTSRWRTQLFSLRCLHQICILVARSGRREHVDLPFARQQKLQPSTLLVSRVPDLIKMAFTASAAYVTEIRLEGLVVLQDVIEVFAKSPDPDYEDSLLLEQHQAPITAALTPAFSSDSTPEILSSAVQVCAAFVGCGVVKDVARMGRILKLLTSALEQSKESGTLKIGDVGELSPNASGMLRISTLKAWAQLQVASSHQAYLGAVVEPHRATLATLWISSLRDYASIRGDSEMLQDSASAAMDVSYSGMGREVLLPYYEASWSKILKAVANLMLGSDKAVLAAMDGQDASNQVTPAPAPPKDEPTAYFFIIFGLVFEALTASSADANATPAALEAAVTALEALRSLVRPEYAGKAILDPSTFDELSNLFYRMAMTSAPIVQINLIAVLASLASSQKDKLIAGIKASGASEPFPGDSPLTHCLRICSYVLRQAVPSASRRGASGVSGSVEDRVALLTTTFRAFTIIGDAFGPEKKEEVRAVAVALYTELLKDEYSTVDLTGPTLPSLKAILDATASPVAGAGLEKYQKLVHGLLSACLSHIDEMRGREGVAAAIKVKNNLLTSVLIVTVVPQNVKLSRTAVEHCCYVIAQKLEEGSTSEISVTAAHCAKTIMIAATAGNTLLGHCVKLLIPGMIHYIASLASSVEENAEGGAQNATQIQGIDEVLKAFVAFFNSVPDEHRARLLGVLLPLCVLLLDPARSPPAPLHTRTISHLLSFATTSPAAFKEATGKLGAPEREKLETSIRQAVGGAKTAATEKAAKPAISLRSF
ncbi:hypothetical protein FS837_002429 [Tulasnella sp. UAMH 9824]|nr:hypothetical protein FS837_002429 [Tulasnella sp. UAMH 9824]